MDKRKTGRVEVAFFDIGNVLLRFDVAGLLRRFAGFAGRHPVRTVQLIWSEARQLGLNPQIVWEGGWSIALRATYAGLSFLTTALLARLLGAAEYGVYAYALALVTLVTIPTQAGVPHLILRETARGSKLDSARITALTSAGDTP